MVQFNFSEKTIKAKVVYYGPAQSGKTTNLEQVHVLTDPRGANRLVSLNTAQDRTLFFDLLPFSLGSVSGYDFQVQLYTVPGQVQYNATRRVVLAGADAVVFVADSRKAMAKENVAAFENMKVNLLANRLVPEKVPLVLQWNKRDLPEIASEAELNKLLNPWGRPALPAAAFRGEGVLETFVAIVQQMLSAIAVKYNLKEKGLDPAAVPELVKSSFDELIQKAAAARPAGGPAPAPAKVVLAQTPDASAGPALASPDAGLVAEELLARSIKSNVEMAEALSGIAQQLTYGLAALHAEAERARSLRDDQQDERVASLDAILRETQRLQRVVQEMGQAGGHSPLGQAAGPAAGAVTGRSGAWTPARQAQTGPRLPATQRSGVFDLPPPVAPSLEGALRDAIQSAGSVLAARGFTVALAVPAGTAMPKASPDQIKKAVVSMLDGVSAAGVGGGQATLRCERKPVLLRGKNGEELRREFLMVALAHDGKLSPEAQQKVLSGSDTGALGEAWRATREVGGFVRFSPLASGGLETRLFIPA